MSKKTNSQEHHKRLLKSALSDNYDNILKGQKMKETKVKKAGIDFKKFGLAFAALAVIAGGALGLTLRDGEITAKQAFAQAQEYYENASSQGRYLYQKAVMVTEDTPEFTQNLLFAVEFTPETTAERWLDTVTGDERFRITNSKGELIEESLTIGDQYYSNNTFNEAGPFGELNEFYEDADENGFPNAYKRIGINSFEELEAADLSLAEIDKLFSDIGETGPNAFMKDFPVGPDGIDTYNTKPSELEAQFEQLDISDVVSDEDAYAQCKAGEESHRKTAKLDKIVNNEVNPNEYAAIFEELANDDFFTVNEVERNGKTVFSIDYDRNTGAIGEDQLKEVVFLNKDTYSLAGVEADYGEFGGKFSMTILEEIYSNNPINISTDGLELNGGIDISSSDPAEFFEEEREELEAQGEDVDALIDQARKDQAEFEEFTSNIDEDEFSFGCEFILEEGTEFERTSTGGIEYTTPNGGGGIENADGSPVDFEEISELINQ